MLPQKPKIQLAVPTSHSILTLGPTSSSAFPRTPGAAPTFEHQAQRLPSNARRNAYPQTPGAAPTLKRQAQSLLSNARRSAYSRTPGAKQDRNWSARFYVTDMTGMGPARRHPLDSRSQGGGLTTGPPRPYTTTATTTTTKRANTCRNMCSG